MKENWKMIAGVVAGGLVLVGIMVWGLTKMSGGAGGIETPIEKLVDGAGWIKETCSTSDNRVPHLNRSSEGSVPMRDTGGPSSDEKHCDYKVTVVEFADLQCPACKQAEPIAEKLRQTSGVRYVLRYFPLLTIHKNAWKAAKTAETARKMGKGWQMVKFLFDKQNEWEGEKKFDELAVDYAEELGLDKEKFKQLYISKEIDEQVVVDSALANELRLSGTPTFFVEGKQVAANFVLAEVKERLKED